MPTNLLVDKRWLLDHQGDASVVLLDTRTATEYLGTGKRARHAGTIPGAKHFATHAWRALTQASLSHARNYTGSWGEWGNRDDLPVAVPSADTAA